MTQHSMPDQVSALLREVDLVPPQLIPSLRVPTIRDFTASLPTSNDLARSLLAQQRIGQSGYKPPEKRLRYRFSTTRLNEKSDQRKWAFRLHEVAKTFDGLLSHEPLVPAGVAQAVLAHAPKRSMDELWCHLHDSELQSRMTSRFRRSKAAVHVEATWLDCVTAHNNLDYIRLLCQIGFEQGVLDRALGVALSNGAVDAAEVLLSYGAVASAQQDVIRERFERDDVVLCRLLLSAPPAAMTVDAWRQCLGPQVERFPSILLLCAATRPDVLSAKLFLSALRARSVRATAIVLAYAPATEAVSGLWETACKLASDVQDDECRQKLFAILTACGLVQDSLSLRNELMRNAKIRQIPLLCTLTTARVALDTEPNNALRYAIEHMDLEVLELFKHGHFLSSVSPLLQAVPDSASEKDMLRVLNVLAPQGLLGEPLDAALTRAVRKGQGLVIQRMICLGASIEFGQASAVRLAIQRGDLDALVMLLQVDCSSEILSRCIIEAMDLHPRSCRLQAMQALMKKGVQTDVLDIQLKALVSEKGDADYQLLQALLQNRVSADAVGDCVLVATQRGNLLLLKMLCGAKPQLAILSEAVPIALRGMNTVGYYRVALSMIKLLLSNGAFGSQTHQALLTASRGDIRLDIVRVLVQYGADANHEAGAAFRVALEWSTSALLRILCTGCPPTQATTEKVLSTALDPRYYDQAALDLLLDCTTSRVAALNRFWATNTLSGNPNLSIILLCLLQHGLHVDIDSGSVLCLAVEAADTILLCEVLRYSPSATSLTSALHATKSVQDRNTQLQTMSLLLEQAKSLEIGQSELILQETQCALASDLAGLHLLLEHNATADFANGQALQAATSAGSIEVVQLLLNCTPTSLSLYNAWCATALSKSSGKRKDRIFRSLLAASNGALTTRKPDLLANLVASSSDTPLALDLLAQGTTADLATLKIALVQSPRKLFEALANSVRSADTTTKLFRYARRRTSIPAARRYWIFECLLQHPISSDDVSGALLECLADEVDELGDLSFPKLFLQHGATVGYQNGKAFALACTAKSLDAVKLLSQYIVSDSAACIAFELVRTTVLDRPHLRPEFYRCLLQRNIHKTSLYLALEDLLESGQPGDAIIQLLLSKGADPNANQARCFLLTCKAGNESVFRALSRYADLGKVLLVLLDLYDLEDDVVRWFGKCIEERCRGSGKVAISPENLLFTCLRKYPQSTTLLQLLLENGVSASTLEVHCLRAGEKPEPCTVLIWALFSDVGICNDSILLLLAQCGDEALPLYSTPVTGVSAAFGCLLDISRTSVLQALLESYGDELLSYKVSGSTFGNLGGFPPVPDADSAPPDWLTLRLASLYLGNVDAFRLLDDNHPPDDGSLHLAALMALPRVVEYLLLTHDPNVREEDFDNRIPLALVCDAKPLSWCRMANEEADFRTRQSETMQLLAPKTNLNWRYRGKTVLHIALENGVETTRAMLSALAVELDPKRHETYMYKDKAGKQYTPRAYVLEFTMCSMVEKLDLMMCLLVFGHLRT